MELLGPVLVIIIAIVAVIWGQKTKKAWLAALGQTGARLDLAVNPGSWLQGARADGVPRGVPLKVDTYTVSHGKSSTTYTRITATPEMPDGLVLGSEGFGASFGKLFKGEDLQVGDAGFDEAVLIRGPEAALRARLDVSTRALLQQAVAQDVAVKDGEIVWTTTGLVTDAERLISMSELVIAVAQALQLGGDDRARLEQVVRSDPSPQVAANALDALLTYHPTAASRALLAELLETGSPAIRLKVARTLGASARAAVEALVADPGAGIVRLEALQWLARLDPDAATRQALAVVEAPRPGQLAAAALEILGREGVPASLPAIERLVATGDPEIRRAAAAALAPVAGAEGLLLELLGDEDDALAIAAADALAQGGTPSAVQRLRARAKGLFVDGDLRRATEGAISRIQERVGRGMGGGLSVATRVDGGLSEADEP